MRDWFKEHQSERVELVHELIKDPYDSLKNSIFQLFQIDLENWFEVEFIFTYKLFINPIVLDEMEYYRVEYMFENYKTWIEKEKEAREQEEKGQGSKSMTQQQLLKEGQKMMGDYSKGTGLDSFKGGNFNIPNNFKYNPSNVNFNNLSKSFKMPNI